MELIGARLCASIRQIGESMKKIVSRVKSIRERVADAIVDYIMAFGEPCIFDIRVIATYMLIPILLLLYK